MSRKTRLAETPAPQQAPPTAEEINLIAAALSDPIRFRALKLICAQGLITSGTLVTMLGITGATLSHHLERLRAACLIGTSREGRYRIHSVRRETLDRYVKALMTLIGK